MDTNSKYEGLSVNISRVMNGNRPLASLTLQKRVKLTFLKLFLRALGKYTVIVSFTVLVIVILLRSSL